MAPVVAVQVALAARTPERPAGPTDAQDGPPSPLSEASSGYFSHSVSSATLSDALGPGPDGQSPGSPPPALRQASPDAELPSPGPAPGARRERPAPQSAVAGATEAREAVSAEQQRPGASPAHPAAPAPGREPPSPQRGAEAAPGPRPPGPDGCRARGPPEPLPPPATPASPFRIQKVRTSELQSFTCMLAGDPGCPSAQEDPPAPGGQALGKLEVSSDSEEATEVPEWLKEGEYVTVGTNKTGVVRYIGPTDFQEGTWVGVELDLPSGKNDGSIGGKQYFRCNPGYGLLVRPGRVCRAAGASRRRSAGLRLQGAAEPRRSSTLPGSASNLASLTAALAKAEGAGALRAERSPKHPESRKSWAS